MKTSIIYISGIYYAVEASQLIIYNENDNDMNLLAVNR